MPTLQLGKCAPPGLNPPRCQTRTSDPEPGAGRQQVVGEHLPCRLVRGRSQAPPPGSLVPVIMPTSQGGARPILLPRSARAPSSRGRSVASGRTCAARRNNGCGGLRSTGRGYRRSSHLASEPLRPPPRVDRWGGCPRPGRGGWPPHDRRFRVSAARCRATCPGLGKTSAQRKLRCRWIEPRPVPGRVTGTSSGRRVSRIPTIRRAVPCG